MKHHVRIRLLSLVATVIVVAGLVWGLAAATAATSSPSSAPGKIVLKIGWSSEPDNLNPFIGYANTSYEIWAINYSFLFGFGANSQPTLDLASQFPTEQNGGISADGKVWTIHLKPNLKWSDGQALTAADVAFTYNYVVQNHMANMAVTSVGIIGAKAINSTTVQIACSRPKADMEHLFLPILPQHIWEHVSPQAAATSYVNQPPIVGSGPFYTVAFKKGSYIEMVRNPYYYGEKPAVNTIFFEMYQNPNTMAEDLKSGALDAAWGVPEAEFKQLSLQTGIHTIAYNFFNWDYLNFNCSTLPSSTGNPVLRDWRFRNALNYAVDRTTLCQIAYDGLAQPGSTILPPNTWINPDYHWQPPANEAYTFDLAKAGQLLTAAGYPLKGGVRLNKQGKPIVLRLWTATDFSQGQTEAKLITGWLQQLGLTVKLSVIDRGTLESDVFNYKGQTYAPDFDMYVDDWAGYGDPGQTLSAETTAEIGGMNEPCWSNAAYDSLNSQQESALNSSRRKDIIWQMQQLMYQQSPWIVLTYPQYLEAVNTSRWTGWVQMFNGRGPAFMTTGGVASYLNLRPKVAVASTTGSSSSTIVIVIVVVAVVVVGGIGYMVIRRRRQHVEEDEA
jgi:peptide/nickel transport system substrate-binding protein